VTTTPSTPTRPAQSREPATVRGDRTGTIVPDAHNPSELRLFSPRV
jgi:hypothetical protein